MTAVIKECDADMAQEGLFFSINCAFDWNTTNNTTTNNTKLSWSSVGGPLWPDVDKWLVAGAPVSGIDSGQWPWCDASHQGQLIK